ncbi:MAG: hypothetical protein M3Y27_29120 [Acidobacteriota bacterium]|nr:hypothetical protein [Acidobacteriota bacterium]
MNDHESPVDDSRSNPPGQKHDNYGKSILIRAVGASCRIDRLCVTSYGASSARIDGTVGSSIAVEIESRTGKQVRGAILDLLLHAYPKKLLILIPKYIGKHQLKECEFILTRFISPTDFRVVILEGTGHVTCAESDIAKVREALFELGWTNG